MKLYLVEQAMRKSTLTWPDGLRLIAVVLTRSKGETMLHDVPTIDGEKGVITEINSGELLDYPRIGGYPHWHISDLGEE